MRWVFKQLFARPLSSADWGWDSPPIFVYCHRTTETLKNNPMTESTQSSLIHLGKVFAAILICALQVLLFLQFMPYGGLYVGLLSLILDLALYCWLVSGAYKALSAPPKRKEKHGFQKRPLQLPLNKHL